MTSPLTLALQLLDQIHQLLTGLLGEGKLLDLPLLNVVGDLLTSISDALDKVLTGLVESLPFCKDRGTQLVDPLLDLKSLVQQGFQSLGTFDPEAMGIDI
jgi:hypothetical protein